MPGACHLKLEICLPHVPTWKNKQNCDHSVFHHNKVKAGIYFKTGLEILLVESFKCIMILQELCKLVCFLTRTFTVTDFSILASQWYPVF